MDSLFRVKKKSSFFKICSLLVLAFFSFNTVFPPSVMAAALTPLDLPQPGSMVMLSHGFVPPLLRGVTIHPEDPFRFDFILTQGDDKLKDKALEDETKKLIKYFLVSMTMPEKDLWVNLSPYESDKIIEDHFVHTEMGRDLLAQDYLLKQLTASLIYPEDELGKEFWKKVYQKAYEKYGTTEIPVNTFNKVWIAPEKAVVYEHGNSAFVAEGKLKVMLAEDFLAMEKTTGDREFSKKFGLDDLKNEDVKAVSNVSASVVREIVVPAIEKEVNEGGHFARLRQIYHSLILAAWFKQALRESLVGQMYVNRQMVGPQALPDDSHKEFIYNQYLEAYKKGVYNYIREDYDPATQTTIPRKYFSGGITFNAASPMTQSFGVGKGVAKGVLPLERVDGDEGAALGAQIVGEIAGSSPVEASVELVGGNEAGQLIAANDNEALSLAASSAMREGENAFGGITPFQQILSIAGAVWQQAILLLSASRELTYGADFRGGKQSIDKNSGIQYERVKLSVTTRIALGQVITGFLYQLRTATDPIIDLANQGNYKDAWNAYQSFFSKEDKVRSLFEPKDSNLPKRLLNAFREMITDQVKKRMSGIANAIEELSQIDESDDDAGNPYQGLLDDEISRWPDLLINLALLSHSEEIVLGLWPGKATMEAIDLNETLKLIDKRKQPKPDLFYSEDLIQSLLTLRNLVALSKNIQVETQGLQLEMMAVPWRSLVNGMLIVLDLMGRRINEIYERLGKDLKARFDETSDDASSAASSALTVEELKMAVDGVSSSFPGFRVVQNGTKVYVIQDNNSFAVQLSLTQKGDVTIKTGEPTLNEISGYVIGLSSSDDRIEERIRPVPLNVISTVQGLLKAHQENVQSEILNLAGREKASSALKEEVGGIYLNPATIDMTIRREGDERPSLPPVPDAEPVFIPGFEGFDFNIINIAPLSPAALPALMGLSQAEIEAGNKAS